MVLKYAPGTRPGIWTPYHFADWLILLPRHDLILPFYLNVTGGKIAEYFYGISFAWKVKIEVKNSEGCGFLYIDTLIREEDNFDFF